MSDTPTIYDMFDRVRKKVHSFTTARPRFPGPIPPEPPGPIDTDLVLLASDRRIIEVFLPWLKKVEEKAVQLADDFHTSHAETSYWLGYSASLRSLRECFDAWRENRTPAPQKGPLNE